MCEYKVGDIVRRAKSPYMPIRIGQLGVIEELSILANRTVRVRLEGEARLHTWHTDYVELVERKAEVPKLYTFKVGDKGRTSTGYEYEVIAEHDSLLIVVYGRDFAALVTKAGVAVTAAMGGIFLLPPTTYVWRINCSGVRNTNKGGLVDMQATRTYDSYDNAVAGYNRALKAYKEVAGPFKEEKKS